MRVNVKQQLPLKTYEGGKAPRITAEQQLRRSVMSCLLWEDEFYEDGETIAGRIKSLVPKVAPADVANLAIDARMVSKLRHAPLLVVREMARTNKHRPFVASTLATVIQRADELAEFVALYWKEKKQPLSAQVKKGLARAFTKFTEYELAKYNRDGAVKLRDVLFLCHACPKDEEQEDLWRRLVNNELAVPDTWEVALSENDGVSKRVKWEDLLKRNRLGSLALLRNLRNMQTAGVDPTLIREALGTMRTGRVLPFRFLAAANHAPMLEDALEEAMFKEIAGEEKLPGTTLLLIDVSGSMDWAHLSGKSEMTRMDAATGLGILARELCESVIVTTFSDKLVIVPPRRGFALSEAIQRSQEHSGTELRGALEAARRTFNRATVTRTIVITDEQSRDGINHPLGRGYVINVASAKNGVGYGAWTHIDGWSESVLRYIAEIERL